MPERFRLHDITLPIEHSMEFDLEQLINDYILANHITFDEFDANFVVEFTPVEIRINDDMFARETKIQIRQEIIFRRKTEEELQNRLESHVNSPDARRAESTLQSFMGR